MVCLLNFLAIQPVMNHLIVVLVCIEVFVATNGAKNGQDNLSGRLNKKIEE